MKLLNRHNKARDTSGVALVQRAPLSEQEVRELLIADAAPLRMTRAAAEYVRRTQPGDMFDVRDRLRTVCEERPCFWCFRPAFVLANEQAGWACTECMNGDERCQSRFTATLGLAELRAVDIALGARLQGPADYLMAEFGCLPVLCGGCQTRFYTFAELPGPHTCAECAEWRADAAAQAELDRQQAEAGRVRVSCKWCDGEFYVAIGELGPHSCWRCSYKDGI